jgi:hypothetical protein
MITRKGAPAALIAALVCAAPATAAAAPTKVNVRIEGKTKTLFEGPVSATIHDVDGGDGSGAHKCDGTNGGAGTVSGVSPTSAMDDATKLAGLTWAGTYDDSFGDFLLSRIGPDSQTDTAFWGVAVAGKSLEVGGCQAVVTSGQEVLWAFDLFGKKLLHARSAKKVRVGRTLTVKVVDTDKSNAPVKGARIGGEKTNAKGEAKLRFKKPGTKRLKATATKAIRSNQLTVKVLKRR